MPAGTVTAGTLASGSQADDGTQYFKHSVDPSVLVEGPNLVAVEVHQNSGTSTDISFDMMIWGEKPGGPRLSIAQTSPGQAQISWQGANTVLQSNSNLGNPNGWNDINPATYQHPGGDQNLNAVTINLGPGNLFFRTR